MTTGPRLLTTLTAAVAVALAVMVSSAAVAPPASASWAPTPGAAADGNDISWPQCPKGGGGYGLPGPQASAKFVVVGLTDGGSFRTNPCLASQVAAAKGRDLWTGVYAITTYPSSAELALYGGTGTLSVRLRRVGAAQAAYNLGSMRRAGLRAPMVWADVEPRSKNPWPANAVNNNAVIDGAIAGYEAGGVRVGIYSYARAWTAITGGRALTGVPTWVPVGNKGRAVAASRCAVVSYSGTKPWLTQWTDGKRDYNITCPGITGKAAQGSILTPYLNTNLAVGSRGAAVAALQRRLGGLDPDGMFGPLTRARVVAVQRSRHLVANGLVTRVVWRDLGAGVPYTPPRGSMMRTLFAST